jgi:hypothetical protein
MSATRSLAQIRGKVEEAAGPGVTLDLDMIHAMTERDNALVLDEAMSGSSGAFTYSFSMQGKMVQGVSVIGARHLASHYGGIKHRLVASIDKNGPRFVSTTYPGGDVRAMDVRVAVIEDMADEPDFYTVLVEITDIKMGLTEQVEITENRMEKKSRSNKKDGDPDEWYERPHFRRIAQSKAFRNGVLNILPQDFVQKFKEQSVAAKNNLDLTKDWLEEIRQGVMRFATAKAIPVNRMALAGLDANQLAGLRDAVQGGLEAFKHSLAALGCIANVTPMREIPMEQNLGPVVDLNAQRGEPVPVPGGPPQAEEPKQQQATPAAAAEAQEGSAPAVTNQGTSMRRVDMSDPPGAMRVWVETYGVTEARRLAKKQGWELPAELEPPLEASMPGAAAKEPAKEADAGPDMAPYPDEAKAGGGQQTGAGPGFQREPRTQSREARGQRRDESGRSGGDKPPSTDLFTPGQRGR